MQRRRRLNFLFQIRKRFRAMTTRRMMLMEPGRIFLCRMWKRFKRTPTRQARAAKQSLKFLCRNQERFQAAPLTEGVTGSENTAPADSAAADKTADADNTGEDSTGSEDEAGFLNEGDSADDRMITAGNAKESDIALCADNTTVQEGTKYTFYFAPPQSWTRLLEGKTITCSFRRGNDNSNESTNGV